MQFGHEAFLPFFNRDLNFMKSSDEHLPTAKLSRLFQDVEFDPRLGHWQDQGLWYLRVPWLIDPPWVLGAGHILSTGYQQVMILSTAYEG